MIDKEAWYEYNYIKATIIYHDYLYYGESAPIITDREYDGLLKDLEKFEDEHPYFITEDSPTQIPGHNRFV